MPMYWTHVLLMEKCSALLCEKLQVLLSVHHLLIDCPVYQWAHKIYFQSRHCPNALTFSDLLADSPIFDADSLFDFL